MYYKALIFVAALFMFAPPVASVQASDHYNYAPVTPSVYYLLRQSPDLATALRPTVGYFNGWYRWPGACLSCSICSSNSE